MCLCTRGLPMRCGLRGRNSGGLPTQPFDGERPRWYPRGSVREGFIAKPPLPTTYPPCAQSTCSKTLRHGRRSCTQGRRYERRRPDTMGRPAFLAVVTATGYAYRRPDGVCVVPIGCLTAWSILNKSLHKAHKAGRNEAPATMWTAMEGRGNGEFGPKPPFWPHAGVVRGGCAIRRRETPVVCGAQGYQIAKTAGNAGAPAAPAAGFPHLDAWVPAAVPHNPHMRPAGASHRRILPTASLQMINKPPRTAGGGPRRGAPSTRSP